MGVRRPVDRQGPEYLWYDLGRVSHSLNCSGAFNRISGDTCSTGVFFSTLGNAVSSIHGGIVRFGINYKFN
jgi:hypothetical protein